MALVQGSYLNVGGQDRMYGRWANACQRSRAGLWEVMHLLSLFSYCSMFSTLLQGKLLKQTSDLTVGLILTLLWALGLTSLHPLHYQAQQEDHHKLHQGGSQDSALEYAY